MILGDHGALGSPKDMVPTAHGEDYGWKKTILSQQIPDPRDLFEATKNNGPCQSVVHNGHPWPKVLVWRTDDPNSYQILSLYPGL